MVGDVPQPGHVGKVRPQQRLDALPQRHFGQAAALAATFEPDADPALVHASEGHMTAVRGDHRVDLRIKDSAGPLRNGPPDASPPSPRGPPAPPPSYTREGAPDP